MKAWRKSKAARMLLVAYIKMAMLVFVCSLLSTMLYQVLRGLLK